MAKIHFSMRSIQRSGNHVDFMLVDSCVRALSLSKNKTASASLLNYVFPSKNCKYAVFLSCFLSDCRQRGRSLSNEEEEERNPSSCITGVYSTKQCSLAPSSSFLVVFKRACVVLYLIIIET